MFLNSLVKILRKNGYNMLYVFIDEVEDISKLKSTKLTNYILTLNTMINNEGKWSVIVSLTEDALTAIKEQSVPLYDRLTSYMIQLKKLDNDKAKKLILSYLNLAREESIDLNPFNEELIKEIVKKSEGNYRSFIRIL